MSDAGEIENIRTQVAGAVAAGYGSDASIREEYVEGFLGALEDDDEVRRVVNEALASAAARHAEEARSWPARTECDVLDNALAALEQAGIVSSGYEGWDRSEAADAARERFLRARDAGRPARGYAFFTQQSVDSAVAGEGLPVAFGVVTPTRDMEPDAAIGQEIADTLRRHGLTVDWDGSATRSLLVRMTWRRRRPEELPRRSWWKRLLGRS